MCVCVYVNGYVCVCPDQGLERLEQVYVCVRLCVCVYVNGYVCVCAYSRFCFKIRCVCARVRVCVRVCVRVFRAGAMR